MSGLWKSKTMKSADTQQTDVFDADNAWRSPAGRGYAGREIRLNDDPWDGQCPEAIAHLPAAYRSAMILSNLEGFSTEEIARLAGVRPHAIHSLLLRGRELVLEELLEDLWNQ